jgi:hypothetical protein
LDGEVALALEVEGSYHVVHASDDQRLFE